MKTPLHFLIAALLFSLSPQTSAMAQLVEGDINSSTIFFAPGDSEATIAATGAARITSGNTTIYIGTHQASGINQNPIMASFTNGVQDWVISDYETTGADGRGEGLVWDGGSKLYAVFSADGTQGSSTDDYRRFTGGGWITSYGAGGGAKIPVLAQIDPTTGLPLVGTFIKAQLSNGNTNTVSPTNIRLFGNDVIFDGDSFFSPLRTDQSRMTQTIAGPSPFDYRLTFNSGLTSAIRAEAIGWDGVTEFSPIPEPSALLMGGGLILLLLMRRRLQCSVPVPAG